MIVELDVPGTWAITTLGEVRRDNARGIVPKNTPDEMFELYSVPSFDSSMPETVTGNEIGSNKQTVEAGTVLLCKINPRINRAWVVGDYSPHRKIASTEWIPFFPVEGVLPSFLGYFLRQHTLRDYLAANVSGVGGSLMRIRPAVIEEYPFPLPPLPEQRRIVAEIETQLSRLDAAVAALGRARANLRRYRAAVLDTASFGWLDGHSDVVQSDRPDFQQLPALRPGWRWCRLEDLIDSGPQNGLYKPASAYGSGIPIVRIDDFQDFSFRPRHSLRTLEASDHEASTYALNVGDILINRVNSAPQLGKCLVVSDSMIPAVFESNMMRIRLKDFIEPRWIASWLKSSSGRALLTTNAKWAVNQASINQKDVCATPVPVPPQPEQVRLLEEVERRLSVVEAAEASIAANLKRAEKLRQAVLREAFAGELVAQDPSDEPAAALLARIADERAAAGGAGRRRARRAGRQQALPLG